MEVTRLTINNGYDDTALNVVRWIYEHPKEIKQTTAYRIARSVSITHNISRVNVSKQIKRLSENNAILSYGPYKAKLKDFALNLNYPGMRQLLNIQEPEPEPVVTPEPAEPTPVITEEPEIIEEPTPSVEVPVEVSKDGQTITINLTINLRR